MSTFQVRVEDKIGVVSDTAALSDFLTAGVKFIVNVLPPERVEKFTTDLTDAGSGVSVTTSRVLRAHKSSYRARRIDAGLAAQAINSSSIHYAGSTDPVWYISNGLAFVKPTSGTVVAMAYPTVLFGDSTIAAFPIDLDEGVVLYACIHGRLRQMSDLTITTLGGLSISTIVKPSAPSAPSFTYADATYTDASYTSADYTPAVYTNALIDTITSTSVSFSDTISYTPPVFTGSYTGADTALTNQDIELSNAHLSKVNSQLDEMQKDLLVSLNEFNKDKADFDANLQIALTDAQLTQQRLVEQTRIQVQLNQFNAQQALQEALANASQESQIDIVNRKAALELDVINRAKAMELIIINESKDLERQISEYSAKLQLYGQEIGAYSTEINEEVSRVSTRIGQYNAQFQQLALGLEAFRQEFNNYLKAI